MDRCVYVCLLSLPGCAVSLNFSPLSLCSSPQGTHTSSFTVLNDGNTINDGVPNAFVKAIQNGKAGTGPTQIDSSYANVNGDTLCNTCGFVGVVEQEFTGDGK